MMNSTTLTLDTLLSLPQEAVQVIPTATLIALLSPRSCKPLKNRTAALRTLEEERLFWQHAASAGTH